MWYVYFLELSNGSIYVGSTPDLKRRFDSHQKGQVQSTKAFIPMILKSYVAVETEMTARELEKGAGLDKHNGLGCVYGNKTL
jgi:predicted GIY-YIG superfamily endonuclease